MWLSDDQYERMAALLPGKASDPGRTAADNSLFGVAVLWIARTGSPWRDLPQQFGPVKKCLSTLCPLVAPGRLASHIRRLGTEC